MEPKKKKIHNNICTDVWLKGWALYPSPAEKEFSQKSGETKNKLIKSKCRGILLYSGLSIWHCHCSGSGYCCGAGSNSGPGNSACCGHRLKERKGKIQILKKKKK